MKRRNVLALSLFILVAAGVVAVLARRQGLADSPAANLATTSATGRVDAANEMPTAPAIETPTRSPDHPDPSPVSGDEASNPPVGVPAIRPSIADAGPGQPVFTADDVMGYVLAHGIQGMRFVSDGPNTVESVEFLSAREVNARLHTANGQPDDALLCLVIVRGNFTLFTPLAGRTQSFTIASLVFDARTGNILSQGLLPPTP